MPRDEKQTLVGQVFSSVAGSYDIMNDLMSGGWRPAVALCLQVPCVCQSNYFNVQAG